MQTVSLAVAAYLAFSISTASEPASRPLSPIQLTAFQGQVGAIAGPSIWANAGRPPGSTVVEPAKSGVCRREAAGVVGRAPQKIGGTIRAPEKIRDARPKYPELPPGTTLGGVWVGDVLVDAAGKVARVWTIRAFQTRPAFPAFNKSIVDAIQQWEYEPLRLNNEPRPFCMTVTININLQ